MTISLIICTRNRAGGLERCLAAVARIRHDGPWEVVVVDNGSTDHTGAVVQQFSALQSFPVQQVFEPVPGLSNARNAGVAAARGAIMLFTDDDCYVEADILDAVARSFADTSLGFVSGRVRLFDPDDFPATINESLVPLRFEPRQFLYSGAIKGANLAFRRTALAAIGTDGAPFDPLLGAGGKFPSGEDTDAAQRATLAGWAGAYVPEMVVAHHHGRRAGDIGALLRSYDIGRGAFHAKLMLQKGGLWMGLRASIGVVKRLWLRPTLLPNELRGALGYWRTRLALRWQRT